MNGGRIVGRRVLGVALGLGVVGLLGAVAPARATDGSARFAAAATARVAAPPASAGRACIPAEECCKTCSAGKACGNSCISVKYACHKGRGCACNLEEICE